MLSGCVRPKFGASSRCVVDVNWVASHFTLPGRQYFLIGNPLLTFTTMSVSAGSLTKAIAQDALPAAACHGRD